MAAVEDFANGANILQQVDVSQIFKSLAMGIAEAQAELDDNSVSQLQRLSETELAGKSLLELGFVPAFYSFTYADISASINLRMAEKTSFELGAEASFDFASNTTAAEDFSDLSKESQFQSEKGEFKSNRKFSMKSSSTKKIKVNNQSYELHQSEGCIKKFESLHDSLLQDEHIERVNMQFSKAYTTVFKNKDDYSVVIINDFIGGNNPMPLGHTCIGSSFLSVFTNLGITAKNGFSGSQIFGLGPNPIEFEFFFDFDKKTMDFDYDKNYTGINNKDFAFESFATILKNVPSLKVTIEGYTDSRGDVAYNTGLSTDRINALKTWLIAKGASDTQFIPQPKGETLALSSNGPDEVKNPLFRKVKVILPANIHFIICGPSLSVTTTATITDVNYIISVDPITPPTFLVINGSVSGFVTGNSLANYQSANSTLFHSEIRNSLLYLLETETEVTFMAYSSDSEEIKIVAEEGSESEIKVYSNENNKERIKNLATKNGSNKTFAASASIDFRMSRQFEMSMEGSASMSARLVAVPPPDQFKTHIATIFNP